MINQMSLVKISDKGNAVTYIKTEAILRNKKMRLSWLHYILLINWLEKKQFWWRLLQA